MAKKLQPLTQEQAKLLFEVLRNQTILTGSEIMELNKNLKEVKLIKEGF